MKKVLITGASGFIGQHLLEDLDYSRFLVKAGTRKTDRKMRVHPSQVDLVYSDLTDAGSLVEATKNIDVVINIAAEVRDAERMQDTNIQGTMNLLEACKVNGVKKIIHISSVGVVGMQYDANARIVKEDHPASPKNKYEESKLASEKLLVAADDRFEIDILRPTNVYGEFHPHNALLRLILHIGANRPVVCTASAMVNYVYVKDLTAAIMYLLESEKGHGILNIGSSMKLITLADLIGVKLGVKARISTVPALVPKMLELVGFTKLRAVSNGVVYDDAKLRALFQYPFGYLKGIDNTIRFYLEKGALK